jgi:ABC-type phosphate/phosphonate transport system substrate-binding protein
MKTVLTLILILFLNSNLLANDNISRFGFLSYSNINLNFKDARDSLSSWIEDLGLSNNIKVSVEFYNTLDELFFAYKNGKLDMIVISFSDFYKNKTFLNNISKDYWSATFNEEKYTQFYLVSLKEKNINSFKDIQNATLSLEKYDTVSKLWFDKNSLTTNNKDSEKILKKIYFETKESTPLLNVFFKKSDLAIVTKDSWNSMVQLNPSIEKKIKIIERSEKIFLPFIGFFSKDTQEEKIDIFFKITSKIEDTIRVEELLSLLKFKSFFRLEDKYIDDMEIYFKEYYNLKEKYD